MLDGRVFLQLAIVPDKGKGITRFESQPNRQYTVQYSVTA